VFRIMLNSRICWAVLAITVCAFLVLTPPGCQKKTAICPRCHGTGRIAGVCAVCKGTGKTGLLGLSCKACGGTGSVSIVCDMCQGTGRIPAQ